MPETCPLGGAQIPLLSQNLTLCWPIGQIYGRNLPRERVPVSQTHKLHDQKA